VIIATYNRPRVLAAAVDSVLQQTYDDWELIVVGDACDSDTGELIASYRDPRLRYLNLPVNYGEQSGPNNLGIAEARGRYIAFLNHDDMWFPDHLAACTGWLEANQADIVLARSAIVRPARTAAGDAQPSHAWRCTVIGSGTEGRYDPAFTIALASSQLARRTVVDRIGGWRPAAECYAESSQEWLFRAWRAGLQLATMPHLTVLMIQSGERPNSYVDAGLNEHDELRNWLADADNLRLMLLQNANEAGRPGPVEYQRRLDLIEQGLSPHEKLFEDRGYGRGDYIQHLRSTRGLSPIPPRERDVDQLQQLYRQRLTGYELGTTLRFGALGRAHRAKTTGWSYPEEWGTWSNGTSAQLSVHLAKPTVEPLVLEAEVMGFAPDGPLTVGVAINEQPVTEWEFTGPQTLALRSVALPVAATADADAVTVTLSIQRPRSPRSCGASEDDRLLGIGLASLALREATPD
jgi:glycosyltransferase involved in cell wall biosynthesis